MFLFQPPSGCPHIFEYCFGDVKQRYVLDNIRFLTWLANPHVAVVVLDNVFSFQIGDVDKRQPGESGHYKHISDHIKYTVKVSPIYYMEFIEGEECGICLYCSDLYSGKRIFGNQSFARARLVIFFRPFIYLATVSLLLVAVYFEIHLKPMYEIAVKTCQGQVIDFIFLLDVTL